jgi:hypothetical protein
MRQRGALGNLLLESMRVLATHRRILDRLETLPIYTGLELVTLIALLNIDAFPGSTSLEELTELVNQVAQRYTTLSSPPGSTISEFLKNSILPAFCGDKIGLLSIDNGAVRSRFNVSEELREEFQELTRELVDWRLAEFLIKSRPSDAADFVCKVSHAGKKPILFLPIRKSHPQIPSGWTNILVNDHRYEANFVKIALNVVRSAESSSSKNELPGLLRAWFGPDVGLPGTQFRVAFEQTTNGLEMKPLGLPPNRSKLQVWKQYAREEIPALFGLVFNAPVWQQGFILKENQIFLLVTLNKKGQPEEFRYQDNFVSDAQFQWQSQNRTKQSSKHGKAIKDHASLGIPVHLFVSQRGKEAGRACPFVYCGEVNFLEWEGEKPITVRWSMRNPVPQHMRLLLKVPE